MEKYLRWLHPRCFNLSDMRLDERRVGVDAGSLPALPSLRHDDRSAE